MLAKSQGVDLPQEWFVQKVFGPTVPNIPTQGSFQPILQALTGTFKTRDGNTIRMRGAYHYGVPTDPTGMIRSIKDGRPFIFAWKGHVYVCSSLRWVEFPMLRVIELSLINPFWTFGSPKFETFNVFRDDPRAINGTFELLIDK
jgi:hypothetical protein